MVEELKLVKNTKIRSVLPDTSPMVGRVVDLADEKTEIQCQRQNDEKSEDDAFSLHGVFPGMSLDVRVSSVPSSPRRAKRRVRGSAQSPYSSS